MNWNQYFKIKSKQKKAFWIFFIILVLINLLYIKDYLSLGPDSFCEINNLSCCKIDNYMSYKIREENTENAANASSIKLNETESEKENKTRIKENKKKDCLDYLWINCGCDLGKKDLPVKIKIWKYRLIYSPLFILTDLIIAYVLSLAISFHAILKLKYKGKEEPKKEEGKGKEGEKK